MIRRLRPPRPGIAAAAVAVVALLASLMVGRAASVSTTSRTLGGRGVAVAACDADGFTVIPNLTLANVVSVTIGGINAACATGTMSVTYHNGLTSSSGTATVGAGGGSVTVTLALPVLARETARIDASITGP